MKVKGSRSRSQQSTRSKQAGGCHRLKGILVNDSNDNDKGNSNKVDMQFPHNLVWKLHTQACKIVGGTKRKLCKKFQVHICKTKKDRSLHAQLCTLWLRSKP